MKTLATISLSLNRDEMKVRDDIMAGLKEDEGANVISALASMFKHNEEVHECKGEAVVLVALIEHFSRKYEESCT